MCTADSTGATGPEVSPAVPAGTGRVWRAEAGNVRVYRAGAVDALELGAGDRAWTSFQDTGTHRGLSRGLRVLEGSLLVQLGN